jgi:hypothetical protein
VMRPAAQPAVSSVTSSSVLRYPDFTTDDAGRTCVGGAGTGAWPESTWQFISVAGLALDRQVTAAGRRHGWTVVELDPSAFAGHGYCSSDSYFKGVFSTSLLEGVRVTHPFILRTRSTRSKAATSSARPRCCSQADFLPESTTLIVTGRQGYDPLLWLRDRSWFVTDDFGWGSQSRTCGRGCAVHSDRLESRWPRPAPG